MNREILDQVKSPFSDELIQKLIEIYISCGCNDNLLYLETNKLGTTDIEQSQITRDLVNQICAIGTTREDLLYMKTEPQFVYESNDSWVTIHAEEETLKEKQRSINGKKPLIYRVYLNLKGQEKADFVLGYISSCKQNNMPYEFKFSRDETRNDQIVILSTEEDFKKNLQIVEELTKNAQLGEIPMLIGEYKDGIGIAEEFPNGLYSPTRAKLMIVRSAVKKYLCDHKDEFYERLSDDEKEQIDGYIEHFEYLYESEIEEKEAKGEKYKDYTKKYYQKLGAIECAKEYIDTDEEEYCSPKGLRDLGNAIKQIFADNSEQFIQEVVKNYRMIGTQVWGFSQEFVFSNATEERHPKVVEADEFLSKEQIATELEVISREGIVKETQAVLVARAEKKEQQAEKTKEGKNEKTSI